MFAAPRRAQGPSVGPPAAARSLRHYQVDALDGGEVDGQRYPGIFPALEASRSTLGVMATGTGKTAVEGEAARRATGRVLLLQYGNDLIEQNRKKIAAWTGEHVALEQGPIEAGPNRLVMASVPTLTGDRLKRFSERHKFDLIIADEAHHAISQTWRDIIASQPQAKVIGLTATPRPKGMGRVFESCAYEYGIDRGIADAWLTDIDVIPINTTVDLNGARVSAGEFVAKDVDAALARCAKDIADGLLHDAVPKVKSVIFTPGVLSAHAAAEHLNARIPNIARAIDGKMDKVVCRDILAAYAAGEFRYLLTCRKLTEGWDDPETIGVMVSACIQSGGLFTQMVGRGTRLWPGVDKLTTVDERRAAIAASPKPRMLLLDPHYLSQQHDLASVVDLTGGDLDDDTRKEAKAILREKGGTVTAAVNEAKERAEERARAIAAMAARLRKVAESAARLKLTVEIGKPIPIFDMMGMRKQEDVPYVRPEDRPTRAMVYRCEQWRIPVPATQRDFRRLMAAVSKRDAKGLCHPARVHWLAGYGINGWKMTKVQARAVRDAIADNGFRPLPPAKVAELLTRQPGEE